MNSTRINSRQILASIFWPDVPPAFTFTVLYRQIIPRGVSRMDEATPWDDCPRPKSNANTGPVAYSDTTYSDSGLE